MLPLDSLASREGQRTHGPSVETPVKRDELISLGVIPRELHRRFNRFRARISKIESLRALARCNRRELLCKLDRAFVVEIGAGHVNQLRRLLLYGADHFWMAMSGCHYRDPCGEIEKFVPVRIANDRAASALGYQRIVTRIGG